jgi:hypothetical protein
MKNPTLKEVNHALASIQTLVEEVEKLKVSVATLRLMLVVQIGGKDQTQEHFASSLEAVTNYEKTAAEPALKDIAAQFEMAKHLLKAYADRKPSSPEHDA